MLLIYVFNLERIVFYKRYSLLELRILEKKKKKLLINWNERIAQLNSWLEEQVTQTLSHEAML